MNNTYSQKIYSKFALITMLIVLSLCLFAFVGVEGQIQADSDTYVCQIESNNPEYEPVKYKNLEDAFKAVQSFQNIKLLKSVDNQKPINLANDIIGVTLNLNSKNIKFAENDKNISISNNSRLIIHDTSVEKSGCIVGNVKDNKSVFNLNNSSELYIFDGHINFMHTSTASKLQNKNLQNSFSNANLVSSTSTSKNGQNTRFYMMSGNINLQNCNFINNIQDVCLEAGNVNLDCASGSLFLQCKNIELSNGSFITDGTFCSSSKITAKGGSFSGTIENPLSGSSITGHDTKCDCQFNSISKNLVLSGGLYKYTDKEMVDTGVILADYHKAYDVSAEEALLGYKTRIDHVSVCKNLQTGKIYNHLENAFNEVNSNEMIQMTDNVTNQASLVVPDDKFNVSLDLHNKSINFDPAVLGSNLTIGNNTSFSIKDSLFADVKDSDDNTEFMSSLVNKSNIKNNEYSNIAGAGSITFNVESYQKAICVSENACLNLYKANYYLKKQSSKCFNTIFVGKATNALYSQLNIDGGYFDIDAFDVVNGINHVTCKNATMINVHPDAALFSKCNQVDIYSGNYSTDINSSKNNINISTDESKFLFYNCYFNIYGGTLIGSINNARSVKKIDEKTGEEIVVKSLIAGGCLNGNIIDVEKSQTNLEITGGRFTLPVNIIENFVHEPYHAFEDIYDIYITKVE